jgi:hypothetical protein
MSMLCDKSNMVPLLNSKKLRESEKSYFVSFTEGGVEYQRWIPRSKTHINKVGQFTVPEWLFEKLIAAE